MQSGQMYESRIGRLHVLTDFLFQQQYAPARLSELAISGGADTIQFRHKTGLIRHRLDLAEQVVAVCRASGVTCIVDDDVAVSLAIGADGVHLGQLDFPLDRARQILGREAIIGGTANTLDQALRAQDAGASYVGCGPVFPTGSKANPAGLIGLDGLSQICSGVSIPIIAIAGITAGRTRQVLDAGAHGVAVMTAVSCAPDPEAATRSIRSEIDAWVNNT